MGADNYPLIRGRGAAPLLSVKYQGAVLFKRDLRGLFLALSDY